jgi:hypothetical protein
MRPGKRFGLSVVQKSELWRRWKTGQSLHEIGRAFDKSPSSIHCVVSLHGGFVPAVRRRSLLALLLPEREDISRGIASGAALRTIAQHLERAMSTVSRKWPGMVAVLHIVPTKRMTKPGSRRCGRNPVCSASMSSYRRSLRVNCCWIGRRDRSRDG